RRRRARYARAVPPRQLCPTRPAARAAPPPPPRVRKNPLLWKERYFGAGGVADEALRTTAYALIILQPLIIIAPVWWLLFDPKEAAHLAAEVRPMVVTLGVQMLGMTALGLQATAAARLRAV